MAAVLNPTSLPDVVRLTRPLTLARDQTLPVLPALTGLLPDGGLQRGSTVAVEGGPGATTLALALAAGPSSSRSASSRAGSGAWVAVVGRDDLGLAAALEVGLAVDRLALVAPPPPEQWATVVAALIGAVDVVVVGPSHQVRAADARRLAARARERGTVLIQTGTRPGRALAADLRLAVVAAEWTGVGQGHGHLQARRVTVEASGRRGASRPRRAELWLPDHQGRIAAVTTSPSRATLSVGDDRAIRSDRGTGAYAGADIDRLVDPYPEVG